MRMICVTGMHRSGTSLAAGVLRLLGVELGPTDAMMAPTPDNPRGYWEAAAITEFNNDLIEHLGGRWHRLPALPIGWERDTGLVPWRKRAHGLIRELFSNAEVAGCKDPRLSVTLPFWRTVTSIDRTLLVVRAPAEVVASINARDGFDSEYGASLWIDYVASAWMNDPGRVVLPYETLLYEPAVTAAKLATEFGLEAPNQKTLAAIEDFCEPDLRHHTTAGDEVPDGPAMRAANALYGLVTGQVPLLADGFAGSIVRHRNQIRLHEAAIEELRHELRVVQRDLRTASGERDRAEGRVDQLVKDVQQRGREMAALHTDLEHASRGRHEFESRADELARQLREAERRAVQQGKELKETKAKLAAWKRKYNALRGRTSVRIALRFAALLGPVRQRLRWQRPSSPEPPGADAHVPATSKQAARLARKLRARTPRTKRKKGPTVSVVILNRDGEHHLRRLLPALARTIYRPFDIVVVDNASGDGSVAYLEGLRLPIPLKVIRNEENASFSEGNNQGIAATAGELVLLLNNDVEPVSRGWLGHMVDTLVEHDAAAVGARLVYPRRPALDNTGHIVHPDLTLQHRQGGRHGVRGERDHQRAKGDPRCRR
jgi:hypothetical protein